MGSLSKHNTVRPPTVLPRIHAVLLYERKCRYMFRLTTGTPSKLPRSAAQVAPLVERRRSMPIVPPLQLTTSPISSPLNLTTSPISSREKRLATYRSPRSCYTLYTPRTNQEQLEITGTMLSEALEVAAEVAAAIQQMSSRAQNQRSDFIASSSDHSDANERGACPICMEQVAEPIACENEHSFCGECLRAYGRTTPRVRCPLCRVPMPALSGSCQRVYSGIAPT